MSTPELDAGLHDACESPAAADPSAAWLPVRFLSQSALR